MRPTTSRRLRRIAPIPSAVVAAVLLPGAAFAADAGPSDYPTSRLEPNTTPHSETLTGTGSPYTLAIIISAISLIAGIALLVAMKRNNRS
ncbi:hypothetical protein [Salininema proteolyticum]|uniref:LPXTG-motif cell wall anchor domain-containing protein n=1 Tax=Salininema proteolyticum TaxID=1607685 RepID=A0ABV8TX55_9ACTN